MVKFEDLSKIREKAEFTNGIIAFRFDKARVIPYNRKDGSPGCGELSKYCAKASSLVGL